MGFFSPGKFVHGQARAVPTDEECVQAITNQALKFLQENRLPTHQTFRLGEKVRLTVNLA
jgi:transcription antitermination factor NusG